MNGPAKSQVYGSKAKEVPSWEYEDLQEAIEDKKRTILVIILLETGEIVGYVATHIIDNYLYLAELFVDDKHRRQGLGQQLVHGVLQAAAKREGKQRVSEVQLEAETDGLVSYYEALGFEKIAGSSTIMRYALSTEASNRAGC